MPTLPAVAKVLRLDFFQTNGATTRVRDRMFFQYTGAGPSVADLNTLITTISSAWGTNISPLQTSAVVLNSILVTDLTTVASAQAQGGTTRTGTRVGSSTPSGTSAVVKFRINRRYRGGHPRLYLGGAANADLATTIAFTGAYQTAVAAGIQAFVTAVETTPPASIGTLTHVNVSYFAGFTNHTFSSGRIRPIPVARVTPLVDVVTAYSVNPNIGSQRRRYQQSV